MTAGDIVCTYHGTHNISGAAFFAAANAINITPAQQLSGARIFLIPTGPDGNQVSIYKQVYA